MKEKTFIQILGLAGTVKILEYLNEHNTASYKDLKEFGSVATLNRRLLQLTKFGLIEHHFQQYSRKEWYTITEKGRKVFSIVEQLIKETT